MSQYLPVSSEQAGLDMSEALWNLASPPALRAPGTVTRYYCAVVEDVAGQWYLDIPDNMPLPVSPLVTEAELAAVVDHISIQEDRLP